MACDPAQLRSVTFLFTLFAQLLDKHNCDAQFQPCCRVLPLCLCPAGRQAPRTELPIHSTRRGWGTRGASWPANPNLDHDFYNNLRRLTASAGHHQRMLCPSTAITGRRAEVHAAQPLNRLQRLLIRTSAPSRFVVSFALHASLRAGVMPCGPTATHAVVMLCIWAGCRIPHPWSKAVISGSPLQP